MICAMLCHEATRLDPLVNLALRPTLQQLLAAAAAAHGAAFAVAWGALDPSLAQQAQAALGGA